MVWSLKGGDLESTFYNVGLAEDFTTRRAYCTAGKVIEMSGSCALAESGRLEKDRVDRASMAPSHFWNVESTEDTWDNTIGEKIVPQPELEDIWSSPGQVARQWQQGAEFKASVILPVPEIAVKTAFRENSIAKATDMLKGSPTVPLQDCCQP